MYVLLKETRAHWKLKVEALDLTLWKTCFGTGNKPVIRLRDECHVVCLMTGL